MPNLTQFAVRRWRVMLIVVALLLGLGVSALSSIPRAEDPHFPLPMVIVRAVLPGAEPQDVEELVVRPMEDAITGLGDVRKITSSSLDGVGVVWVEFNWSVDPEQKFEEVQRELATVKAQLPNGVVDLQARRARMTEQSVVQVALISDVLPMRRLEKLAHDLQERLYRVPGVRRVDYWGAVPSEMRVSLDTAKLAELGVSPAEVANALRGEGAEVPIGAVHAGDRRFNVKSGGAFRDAQRVADTPIRAFEGQLLRVGDVATVAWAQSEPTHLARFNGQRAVFVTVAQNEEADVARLTEGISGVLHQFQRLLPGSVKLEPVFFQAENVERRLNRLKHDFIWALVLVMVTLLPLGIRAAGIVAVTIPLSLLTGLALLQLFGFSLNQLSIAGFVLSLGLLVDDSIVVTENISRHVRRGAAPMEAAIAATRQITPAVLGCTATLVLAFLPLIALPDSAGAFIRSLPVAVVCTVGSSLIIGLTVTPFLAGRLLRRDPGAQGNWLLQRIEAGIRRGYGPLLRATLARPWAALIVLATVSALTIPLLALVGSSVFPAAEIPQFLVRVQAPTGASLARTDEALRYVDNILAHTPEVRSRASNLGRGNPKVFYNQDQEETSSSYAEVFVALKTWQPGESEKVLDGLRRKFSDYPGAQIKVVTFQNGPPVDAPIVIRISGEDLQVLGALAARVEGILRATPGTRDVGNDTSQRRTDLDLRYDGTRGASLGARPGAVAQLARLALTGEEVARFRDGQGDDYPVRVRLPMSGRNELSALGSIQLPTADGAAAPITTVINPSFRTGLASISHLNRERIVTITSHVRTGYLTSAVTSDVRAQLGRELVAPPGYRLRFGGEAEAQEQSVSGLGAALLLAIFGITAVLVLEFGSFRAVAVVATVIPLGLFGAVAALWLTGYSLSFTAAVGLVALIGIEIKNSILLVDFTEQLRRAGVPLQDAIQQAGEVRFMPVLLTTITAIGGLLPLALSRSGLYAPLAIVIIGGLVSSTLLSRIATPVTYWLFRRGSRARREEGAPKAHATPSFQSHNRA